jgi:hypothetical protein
LNEAGVAGGRASARFLAALAIGALYPALLIVKFPDPPQPDPVPVNVQVPVMVLLLSVPCRVSWLIPLVFAVPDWIVIWNAPLATLLEVLVEVKVPLAVVPSAKQDEEVPKPRLVTVSVVLLLASARVAVKVNAVEPSGLVRVAVQPPLIALFEPPPQAGSIITDAHRIERQKYLMRPPGE